MNRTTVSFDSKLYRAIKIKAAATGMSVSDLIGDAVRQSLGEDERDLAAFDERKGEPKRPFEEVLKELKRDGLL